MGMWGIHRGAEKVTEMRRIGNQMRGGEVHGGKKQESPNKQVPIAGISSSGSIENWTGCSSRLLQSQIINREGQHVPKS